MSRPPVDEDRYACWPMFSQDDIDGVVGELRAENARLVSRLAESQQETRVLFAVQRAFYLYGPAWDRHRPALYRLYNRTFPIGDVLP
jgi:hypothetical protein